MSLKLSGEWVAKAEEDFQAAMLLLKKRKPALNNSVCFHSQQCAEKYLKAFLVSRRAYFPKTHDLILLNNLCVKSSGDFELISDLVLLINPYSVEFRYPGEQATKSDAKKAFQQSAEVRGFVRKKLVRPRKRKRK
ncbi:MAG: HEPN domain-containing protein [Candidatus Omnitrophica bacterium]|nr:HEPN domain-containing protein [Candidatus Omnitrophota bacterium]